MKPSLALSIGAVLNVLIGLAILVAPGQLVVAAGWPATPDVVLVVSRDSGTLLVTLGIVNWLARDAVGVPLRGLL
jgi:hypothetical protein